MITLLLALIYIAFISLGLPDSLLGSAWPIMQTKMNVPLSYAGIITMIIAGGTIISSLMSEYINKRFKAGIVTVVSVLLTAIALFGFSISTSFSLLCLWAVPYGIGAGAVDATLNNYVANRFSSRHMNWLHCFWGIGAALGPYIMSYALMNNFSWNKGYQIVSIIQITITIILFCSLPLWKSVKTEDKQGNKKAKKLNEIIKLSGIKYIMVAFFSYCALESTAGLWASSYLVHHKNISSEYAALFASFFYLGITFGRLISGFISNKLGNKKMIRIGLGIIFIGLSMIILPISSYYFTLIGLIVVGIGCGPIYPAIIHSTPDNFGKENSQAVIGVEMACAYTGSTFIPPLFGLLASHIDIIIYPFFLFFFAVSIITTIEIMNRKKNQVLISNNK